MPYRTSQNVISGLVVTFFEVTESKSAEIEISKVAAYTQNIVDTVRQPLLVLDEQLRVVSANRSFFSSFELVPPNTVGRLVYEIGDGQWDIPALRELLEQILPRDEVFENLRLEQVLPDGGKRNMVVNGRRLEQAMTLPGKIHLAVEDITQSTE
ncbi:MAG: PAS domain-containing protein [Planctomycetaceae bacterium]